MNISYSQFGEDLLVRHYFQGMDNTKGIFVDVGAYHPFKWSNTMLLSKLGWRGINLDASPEKIVRFNQLRPQDHNVCAAVSDAEQDLLWLQYPIGATDRLVARDEQDQRSACGEQPVQIVPIKALPLTRIVDESPFRDRQFHYLNVDCEGHDLAVLQGLNFERYSPDLITVEALDEAAQQRLTAFLEPRGYKLTDQICLTRFYQKHTPSIAKG